MKEFIIIALCALAAFVISLVVTYIIVVRSRPVSILDFVKKDLKNPKSYKAIICTGEKCSAIIVAFRCWEIAVFKCTINGNDFSVEKPAVYSEENLSFIEVEKNNTDIRLFNKDGSPACSFLVKPGTARQICREFPIDVDFSGEAGDFCTFIDKFQHRLEDKTNNN